MQQAIRDGIIVILVISGPLVLAAAAIGLTVGILQAATQIQEQTIGSALKIVGLFMLIIIFGYWMFGYVNQFTIRTIRTAFTFVPSQSLKVLPSDKINGKEFSIPSLGSPKQIESELPSRPPLGTMNLGAPSINTPPVTERRPAMLPTRKPVVEISMEELPDGYQELMGL